MVKYKYSMLNNDMSWIRYIAVKKRRIKMAKMVKNPDQAQLVVVCKENENFTASEVFAAAILDFITEQEITIARGNFSKNEIGPTAVVIRKHLRSTVEVKKRPNGVPYSVAGEFWQKYGQSLVDEETFAEADEHLMQRVDLHEYVKDKEDRTFGKIIIDIIETYNSEESSNEQFVKAIRFAKDILRVYFKKSLKKMDEYLAELVYGSEINSILSDWVG